MTEITVENFFKADIRAGTILEAKPNPKSRKPAYFLKVDFGELGIKTSSAQITENYSLECLIGRQVIAVINFPSKRVAGIKSEILILACVSDTAGTVLLQPGFNVPDGSRVY